MSSIVSVGPGYNFYFLYHGFRSIQACFMEVIMIASEKACVAVITMISPEARMIHCLSCKPGNIGSSHDPEKNQRYCASYFFTFHHSSIPFHHLSVCPSFPHIPALPPLPPRDCHSVTNWLTNQLICCIPYLISVRWFDWSIAWRIVVYWIWVWRGWILDKIPHYWDTGCTVGWINGCNDLLWFTWLNIFSFQCEFLCMLYRSPDTIFIWM